MNVHQAVRDMKSDKTYFASKSQEFAKKYSI